MRIPTNKLETRIHRVSNYSQKVCGQHTYIRDHLTNLIVSNVEGKVIKSGRKQRPEQSLVGGLTVMGYAYHRFPILSILIGVHVTLFVIGRDSLARAKLFMS